MNDNGNDSDRPKQNWKDYGFTSIKAGTGVLCPDCKGNLSSVHRTQKKAGQITRVRVCRNPNCNRRFITRER